MATPMKQTATTPMKQRATPLKQNAHNEEEREEGITGE